MSAPHSWNQPSHYELPTSLHSILQEKLAPEAATEVDFSLPDPFFRIDPQLTVFILQQPACYPVLFKVHLRFNWSTSVLSDLEIRPRRHGGVVTVGDVLRSIHSELHKPLDTTDGRAQQSRAMRVARLNDYIDAQTQIHDPGLRLVDLLDGNVLFNGITVQSRDCWTLMSLHRIRPDMCAPFYGHKHIAQSSARFITHAFECPDPCTPDSLASTDQRDTLYTIPPFKLAHFIAYVIRRTATTDNGVYLALILLQRLKGRYPTVCTNDGRRLFVPAVMTALKHHLETTYSNRFWKLATQNVFSLRELNQMERALCYHLDWDFVVTSDILDDFRQAILCDFSRDSATYPRYSYHRVSTRPAPPTPPLPFANLAPVYPQTPADAVVMVIHDALLGTMSPIDARLRTVQASLGRLSPSTTEYPTIATLHPLLTAEDAPRLDFSLPSSLLQAQGQHHQRAALLVGACMPPSRMMECIIYAVNNVDILCKFSVFPVVANGQIMVQDVLNNIRNMLRESLTDTDLPHTDEQSVQWASSERLRLLEREPCGGPDIRRLEEVKGIRRIDFLLGNVLFAGLTPELDRWRVHLELREQYHNGAPPTDGNRIP